RRSVGLHRALRVAPPPVIDHTRVSGDGRVQLEMMVQTVGFRPVAVKPRRSIPFVSSEVETHRVRTCLRVPRLRSIRTAMENGSLPVIHAVARPYPRYSAAILSAYTSRSTWRRIFIDGVICSF